MSGFSTLEVVFKITERCNINCSYCYMFNRGNDDYLRHPIYISEGVVSQLAQFLKQAVDDYALSRVTVIFHGGEPLMLKRERFEAICTIIREALTGLVEIKFGMQTNAMLLNEAWIKTFAKFGVGIGISLDGRPEANDQVRVDHRGRGTYEKVIQGLHVYQRAVAHDLVPPPGVICVARPAADGAQTYRHFVDDLGFDQMSFVLPMNSHDDFEVEDTEGYWEFLSGVLQQWLKDDNPYITVRLFEDFIRFLGASARTIDSEDIFYGSECRIVSIASNGDISLDDELKPIGLGQNIGNVVSSSLRDVLESEPARLLNEVWSQMPGECAGCQWVGYCRGGAQHQVKINRFSKKRGFVNRSILCSVLDRLYTEIYSFLAEQGMDKHVMDNSLKLASAPLTFVEIT